MLRTTRCVRAPLRTPPPPGFENWNSHGCSVAARRCSSPWPIDRRGRRCWSPRAQNTSSVACACCCRRAAAAVGSSGGGGRRSRCTSVVAFCGACGWNTGRRRARVALRLCCCFRRSGTADVQRAEIRLCMSGLCCEILRSASCLSMCVHNRYLATFASVTIWMCICAYVLLRR